MHNGHSSDHLYACIGDCRSRSRVALMTGRYPAKANMQHLVVIPMQPYYLPLNYSTLADKLKEQGYMNHIVGKWHLGDCSWSMTPMWRGFDSHYGCYQGATSDFESHVLTIPFQGPPLATGIDMRDNTGVVTHQNGTHNTLLFSERAERIVRNHNPEFPLFLYVPFMAPHFPLQAPKGFENTVEVDDADRRTFAGMMAAMDQGVGNITQALKDKGMWDDTIFVFLSDNGGDAGFAGSNYPFRGNKATMWEGGVKVPGFIHGSMLKNPGSVNNELYHFTDIFATLLTVAGGTPDDDIDGINQWDSFCEGKPSERSEILLHLDEDAVTNGAALRMGDYKYMEEDPLETNNLFNDPDKQDIINEMKQRLDEYRASAPPYWFPDGMDPRGNPANSGGYWTPGWC
uniref:Arylsulfatase J-like n=1 Tax=Saccoglossus kowalevskii TaxID=10224 RepID=A0ABM0MMD5_SACKO|nr:PREDICTED: arylsulfatase J-like [Saccoglossus kowalevskii]